MTDSETLPLPKFLRLRTATGEDIAARLTARDGIFGVKPGMTAAELGALGIPKSVKGHDQRYQVTLKGDEVTRVDYAYMGPRGVGRALQEALSERHGAPKGAGARWDTDCGRYVLKSKYRAGPGYHDVTLTLSAAPTKKKSKSAPRRAKPKAADTAESLAAAFTSHLHDIQGDVYDDGGIDRVLVSPQGSGWRVEVIAEGTGGSASFTWSEPVRDADGRLDSELIEAVVEAGGRAIED